MEVKCKRNDSECPDEGTVAETKTGCDKHTGLQEIQTDCLFYVEGRCRFGDKCHNFHNPDLKANINDKVLPKGKKCVQEGEENLNRNNKRTKNKMRTALDVIHRIQWDDALPEESFTIGYEDRFTGIQVKNSSWYPYLSDVTLF